jgi:hypothetical protein
MSKFTKKDKSALDAWINDPTISQTEAVMRSNFAAKDRASAGAIASRVFNKPTSKRYLEEHAEEAKNTIIYHMRNKDNAKLSFEAAKDILDRTDGRPTQKVKNETSKVVINADFTGGQASQAVRPKVLDLSPEPDETPEVSVLPPSADD